tara:strand:- start:19771 stop:20343 length:573 start_codon:yes stop_codon:yes gene_type:complete
MSEAKKKRAPWEQAARVSILGEKQELKSLEEYWVRPKKYGVFGENEIQAAALKESKKIPAKIVRKLTPLYEGKKVLTPADMLEVLSEDEIDLVIDAQTSGEMTATYDVMRLSMYHGIGAHNFDDIDGSNEYVSDDLVKKWLEYEPVATEIYGIVTEHNRPLASTTDSTSETLPDGSTTEQNTSPEPAKKK